MSLKRFKNIPNRLWGISDFYKKLSFRTFLRKIILNWDMKLGYENEEFIHCVSVVRGYQTPLHKEFCGLLIIYEL